MSCRTLRQSGKCPPLVVHIDQRWERSRPMEYSHTLLEESSIFYCNIYILRFDIFGWGRSYFDMLLGQNPTTLLKWHLSFREPASRDFSQSTSFDLDVLSILSAELFCS